MYDIITVGEILVEILTDHVGQKFSEPGKLLGPYPSGAPAIAIDQAGRMGARAAIIAKVGKDDFAKVNLDRLIADGVDVSHVKVTESNSTGTAFVTYFENGDRQFIFHFSHAACGELRPSDIDADAVRSSKYLHIMGCSITASPSMGAAVMEAVRIAVESGVKISFDPNIRPELLSGQIMDYYYTILEACDVLLTGKSELRVLFGDAESGIRDLLSKKDRIVVVKDGSRGTELYTRAEAFYTDTYKAVEVDPTGAGDCFDGTFLAMLASDSDLKTAVRYANAAGALGVEKRGPMEGNSFRADLETFMAKGSEPKTRELPSIR